jgi:hypothetical protein
LNCKNPGFPVHTDGWTGLNRLVFLYNIKHAMRLWRVSIDKVIGDGRTDTLTGKNISRRGLFKIGARVMLAGILGKGVYNTSSNQVEAVRSSFTVENLPETFRGFKIAFLTDLHASYHFLIDNMHIK